MVSAKLNAAIKKINEASTMKDIRANQKALDELGMPGRAIFICYHLHRNNASDTARFCGVTVDIVEKMLPDLEAQVVGMYAPKKAKSASSDE